MGMLRRIERGHPFVDPRARCKLAIAHHRQCHFPGWIQTSGYESLFERDHEQHLSRRVGQPDDIARICLFLCLPENDFVNGENIVADGGMTRK